ncbi:hypothetical protein ACMHYT_29370 [Rhodococcus qingshengii]|uniref:hypothetical protein n=1 Tax=Rhodococcus TaxID=1827 RepID=UPI00106F6474|nr:MULTISPECIES: hypothetical protein [Rhodococcus]MBS2993476.1 hypothetical protein [Rhodococcus erythropolis]MCJ0950577.1 hypothetical protein [Rhodococcus sp. ARC_M8]MCZ4570244.1 hypothetical protein [Rhodococcus erythropolis]MDV8015821.1 hypothetical protein [Rhodococcus sp. IEGM 1241]UGQ55959.1 hypothetical protein LRL17_34350 [Rhodococcus qingshengii]
MTRRRSESERPPHLDSRLSTAPAQSASKPEDPRPVMLARIDARIRARSRSVSATKSATLALGAWTERAVTHCGLTVSEIASHLGMARTTLTEFRRQANAADYTITDEQDGGILQLPAHDFVDCVLSAGPLAEIITSTDPSDLVYLSGQPLHRFDLSSRGSVPHLMVRCGDDPDNWFMLSRSGFDGANAADNIRLVLVALGVEMHIIDHITRHTVTHLALDDEHLRTSKAHHLGLPLPEEIEGGRRHLITLTGKFEPSLPSGYFDVEDLVLRGVAGRLFGLLDRHPRFSGVPRRGTIFSTRSAAGAAGFVDDHGTVYPMVIE